MKENLKDYVKIFNSVISTELCKEIIKDINNNKEKWDKHIFVNNTTNEKITQSAENELSMTYCNTENTRLISKKLWDIIFKYIKDLKFPWFDSWNGYSEIRFNIYEKNQTMANHCDHIQTLFDGNRKGIPTLSVLGILNDNYKGGEFQMFEKKLYKLKQGDIIIFPSLFLFPHKVLPIKKGTRYSFISWVW